MPRYFQRIRFHTSWRLLPPTGADTTREYSGLIRLHVSSFSCIFSLVVYVYLPKNTLFRSSRVLEVAPLLPESECKITTSFQYKPNLPATFLQSFLHKIRNALNDTQINFIGKNMVLEDFFCSGVKKGLYCCLGYMGGFGRRDGVRELAGVLWAGVPADFLAAKFGSKEGMYYLCRYIIICG